jgi:hypothetical protein
MSHSRTPRPVALVPYTDAAGGDPWMDPHNLLQVAAALNIQAQRDLAPVWSIEGVSVAPFLALEDVPPGYGMVVILPEQNSFPGPKGFHFLDSETPVAVVQDGDDWSLYASHELLEMLCDPDGDRTLRGPSLEQGQGLVDHLVEICDPCQHSTCMIDGVLLSDFVTPAFYTAASAGTDTLFSFTGRITGPRQLLEGGYLTWSTPPPRQEVWQAIAAAGTGSVPAIAAAKSITKGPLTPARLEREWVDVHSPTPPGGTIRPSVTSQLKGDQPLHDAQNAFVDARSEAQRNGAQARTLIANVLRAAGTRFSLAPTQALLDQLSTAIGQQTFLANASAQLGTLTPGTPVPPSFSIPAALPSPDRYTEALQAFDAPNRFGTDLCGIDVPGLLEWMCQLGGF